VTVSCQGGHWYISVQVEKEQECIVHPYESAIGIDLGISRFAALSDGSAITGVNSFKKHESKLARLQRQLSKKVKFSENWKKQVNQVKRLHHTIANVRNDFLHKTSTLLSKNHAMIVVEDLKSRT
jgi:putative transposase